MKKFITGGLTTISLLFWTAIPALAADTVQLCPDSASGLNVLCTNTPSAGSIVATGINILLLVAFVAALAFLVMGGIRWIMSGGDKEGTGKAKNAVTSALVGLVIVLSAWILINVVLNFFRLPGIGQLTLQGLGQIPTK